MGAAVARRRRLRRESRRQGATKAEVELEARLGRAEIDAITRWLLRSAQFVR